MPRPKPKFEDHKHFFKDVNIVEYPSAEKYNNNTRISIKCENGHIYKLSVNNIKNQNKDPTICPHCIKQKNYKELGIPEKEIKEYCDKYNLDYEPKKEYYNRWTDSIKLICKFDGNEKEIKSLGHWETHKSPFKCKICEDNKKGLISKKEFEEKIDKLSTIIEPPSFEPITPFPMEKLTPRLKERIQEQEKWTLVEFINTKQKCKYQCNDCGIIKECYPNSIFHGRGGGCDSCRRTGDRKRVYRKISAICNKSNIFTLETIPYKKINESIKFKCNKCGEEFERYWNHINNLEIVNCPSCFKSTKRNAQNKLWEWVDSLSDDEVIQEDKSTGVELDIYVPSKKLAIEYCGLIWHSTKFKNDNNSHKNKLEHCESKGIRLITIFEDEWTDQQEICKSRIKNALGITENRLFARKCEVKKIENSLALQFCSENHIQGKGQTSESYGLFYNDELVSVMTFSKPSISKNGRNYDWELNRFCSKLDYVIVGGANRLLNHFKRNHKNEILVTFCDRRWGTGNVYDKMGFTQISVTRPNYFYIGEETDWKRKHRFNFTKQKLKSKYKVIDNDLTEFEIAEMNGLSRIYDCGHLKFKMTC